MKAEVEYCLYTRWPEDGDGWIHPQDVALARRLIPSDRVFRHEGREGPYVIFRYGRQRLRIKPTLRQAIRGEGFDIGDRVEVCSQWGKNRPLLGVIADMRWNARRRLIQYRLQRRNMTLARIYTALDLRHVERDLAKGRGAH